jgi:hypothetical protein
MLIYCVNSGCPRYAVNLVNLLEEPIGQYCSKSLAFMNKKCQNFQRKSTCCPHVSSNARQTYLELHPPDSIPMVPASAEYGFDFSPDDIAGLWTNVVNRVIEIRF